MSLSNADKLKNNPKWYDDKNWFVFLITRTGYQFPGMILSTLTMGGVTAILAAVQTQYHIIDFPFPNFFHTVLGLVVGLLLVFRTNTAYDRWWEGRKKLGELVNTSRNLGIKFASYLEGKNYEGVEDIMKLVPAFAWAMKEHLREKDFSKAPERVPQSSIEGFEKSEHKPVFLILEISRHIRKMYDQQLIRDGQLKVLEDEVAVLSHCLGACERIRNTPIPLGYSLHLKRILLIYLLTVPITFIKALEWGAVPFSMIIFYTMVGIELIGEEIEDPFGTDPNDLPFDALELKIKASVEETMKYRTVVENSYSIRT